jgi:hypothetical protein
MHASDTTVVSCTVAGRAWSLATRDGRYALSDDVRGRVYVGDKRGLSAHAPPDVLLALSVELEKAQRRAREGSAPDLTVCENGFARRKP